MVEAEVRISEGVDLYGTEELVERCCTAEGLHLVRKGTLARYRGSVHWHFQRGTEPGTLEVTLQPSVGRLWLSVRPSRSGSWTADTVSRLQVRLTQALQARSRRGSEGAEGGGLD